MDQQLPKQLLEDTTGLLTYEYIANNINSGIEQGIDPLVDNIIRVDRTAQFIVSTARYLTAIDRERFAEPIDKLVKAAITADRERAYLPDLAASIWGKDYKENAERLIVEDDNFRRIYKRLYPIGI